ncbi:acylphosphatase [Caldibacillus lycopersici]|uniref:Acylphosphatase n=1 Tax=Perspicuibacillus lycopersici TaxID=1325689 RepID=A0AAE3IUL5_9BACI|nr:acylphosphatase [Perspicuibacillus lycopersici]MCU9612360.1 acylphosphatase [Perspicuibacillus lycopersici]
MLATIVVSGRVQGVGFRYTVYQLAKEYEIKGWVRNLENGMVEIDERGLNNN